MVTVAVARLRAAIGPRLRVFLVLIEYCVCVLGWFYLSLNLEETPPEWSSRGVLSLTYHKKLEGELGADSKNQVIAHGSVSRRIDDVLGEGLHGRPLV